MSNKEKRRPFVHYLPVYGCFSTGIVYVSIGVIAILSFLKIKEGGADESSLIVFLNDFIVGKIIIYIILFGTIGYIFWRFYESIKDPYGYGRGAKGIALRIGIALSTVADMLLVYSAVAIILGSANIKANGQPEELRKMLGELLEKSCGKYLMLGMGSVIILTAIIQGFYGFTKGYKERLESDQFSNRLKSIVHSLAWTGYLSRGIILGITGFFFIKAGVLEDAKLVVNTDKAFDFIGTKVGHIYFILVAAGTISYGIFTFILGLAYDADKD